VTVSSKNKEQELENNEIQYPKKLYHETKNILVSISKYQSKQIAQLCTLGIAKNPTDFTRMAILEKIRENKELLDKTLTNPAWRKELKEKRLSDSSIKGN
jgi:hypothetical protein